jgi:hypothetical protein
MCVYVYVYKYQCRNSGLFEYRGGRWNEKVVGEVKTEWRVDDVMCYHEHALFSYIDIDLPFPPKTILNTKRNKMLTNFIHSFILFEANTISYHITSLALIRISEVAWYVVRQIDRYIARY